MARERTRGGGMGLMKRRSLNDAESEEGQTFKMELGLESMVIEMNKN